MSKDGLSSVNVIDPDAAMEKMKALMDEEDTKTNARTIEEIKEQNKTAIDIIDKFRETFEADVDGITFMFKPINVDTWIKIGHDVLDIKNQAYAVKQCLVSPVFTDAEFILLDGAIIHQVFKILYHRFFVRAKTVSLKT